MRDIPAYQAVSAQTPSVTGGSNVARRQVETAMEQIRSASQILSGLASMFPAAAEQVDEAKKALVKVTTRIVGSQTQPEQPQPTGVMG